MADVTDNDIGLLALEKDLKALDNKSVKVGVQAGEGSNDGVDLLDIAIFNEYGTQHIPPRRFMRLTAEKQSSNGNFAKVLERYLDLIHAGALSPDEALRRLGEWYQGVQRKAVIDGPWYPNAPSTIAKKGSNKPLVDTGKMVNAIRYEVE